MMEIFLASNDTALLPGSTLPAGAGLADAIPPHPLGVKPLGNRYIAGPSCIRDSVGIFATLPDEMLMIIWEYLDAIQLRSIGSTCRFLYAFCHSEELWRALYLRSNDLTAPSRSDLWHGSWRATVLGLSLTQRTTVDCSSVYSDVLYRPYACGQINPMRFALGFPKSNQMPRLSGLSANDFTREWADRPFILTDCVQEWPAWRDWALEGLLHRYGDVRFRAEAVDWPFATYHDYMNCNTDESPLYLFDCQFIEKMASRMEDDEQTKIGVGYWKPACFGTDLFEVLGSERPAYRWLIVGPSGSGSTFHKDPNGTSAWNAVLRGSKYWIMFPPGVTVPGVFVSPDGGEVTSPLSIAEWLLEFHAEARRLPRCVEAVCSAGEVVHVPSGWWHLVVNLESCVAVTQNFVPLTPDLRQLRSVLLFLRDRPDQVTGFDQGGRDTADPYKLLTSRLEEAYPDLVEKALNCLSDGIVMKRKWHEVVAVSKSEATGFSFGFCVDEDLEGKDTA